VADAARLLGNVRVRELQARLLDTDDSMLQATVRIARDRAVEAIFAEVVTTATELAGAAAIVRPADGGVVAGDLAPERAVAIARGAIPPALVQAARTVGDPAATAAVVSIGEGLCLVAVGLRRDLDEDDVQRLAALSDAAAAAIAQVTERDRLGQRVDELDAAVAEQGRQLKERDDAVASAVHELRTPLTSVQAYGQIMSKNLQAVQRQVAQLDRLIDDLLHMQPGTSRLRSLTDVDLLREARDAANRLRLVSQADVEVTDDGSGDFAVNGDPGRLAQVLDNLLGNAAKFSPPGEPINVDLRRADAEVVLSVTDAGAGIAAADLPRVFDRYFRGAEQRESVSGAGIGLAVSRDIVAAHGGRIWATSAGPGHGSTFSMALPALVKAEVR
ncbi:MAG TPA: ATP-binding protein, partial [Candidatus Limnocylindria bacterium]